MPLVYDDEPGSWGRLSEGWPSIEDPDNEVRKLVIERKLVPYGSYVTVGGRLRVETQAYLELVRAAIAARGQAVLTNPHTGTPRDFRDVESDPAGVLIVAPDEPVKAAPSTGNWELVRPDGTVAARASSPVKALARIDGYKPTVEHLLAYEEQGYRIRFAVAPVETFGVSEPGPERPADANVRLVQQKLGERAAVGLRKYGVTTERKDLSLIEWLVHLQEELMDGAVYVQAAMNHLPVGTPVSTSERERWNIERDGDALLVCFNDHSRSDGCRYQRFVPEEQPASVAVPLAVLEMLADGWTLDYSADTGFVGVNHPRGGKQSVLEICKGRRDQGIGEFIVAALSARSHDHG